MLCCACKGPTHPATGWQLSPDARLCGPCAMHFAKWYKGTNNRVAIHREERKQGDKIVKTKVRSDFYEHAATSIRPPLLPPDCECNPMSIVRCNLTDKIRCIARVKRVTAVGSVSRWIYWIAKEFSDKDV